MTLHKLLVANRGEIAIRIVRAAAELGMETVAVYSEDDANSLHTRKADVARPLQGSGAKAYLDQEQLIAIAEQEGCDAVHPGYGFLSENADFAQRCGQHGLTFVGPRPDALQLFGNKSSARDLAAQCGVPLFEGTSGPTSLEAAQAFLQSLGADAAVMIKALAGGGGRGMRAVSDPADLPDAYERCRSEAQAYFGNGDLYVERFIPRAKHVEVQVIGDGTGSAIHVWERECSAQRRNQKLVEIAPAPKLDPVLRNALTEAAVRMAAESSYNGLGTIEFLVDASRAAEGQQLYAFMEANPRLQVEHTVTEEVTGLDLVRIQLQIASGATLDELGLQQDSIPDPHGYAIQARVNMETMSDDGAVRPSGGTLQAFEPPSGRGIRVDTFGYSGYTTSPSFDSLLAKLVVHSSTSSFEEAARKAYRALCEFRIEGVNTNLSFLQNLVQHPDFVTARFYTRFVDDHVAELVSPAGDGHRQLYVSSLPAPEAAATPGGASRRAGGKVDSGDPLAVLNYGQGEGAPAPATPAPAAPSAASSSAGPDGSKAVSAPVQGTIVSVTVEEGALVREGQQLLVMEAMKMEHVVHAPCSGVLRQIDVAAGDTVFEGHSLAFIDEQEVSIEDTGEAAELNLDAIRPDLDEVRQRHEVTLDISRPDSVERRRKKGQRTARENVNDLVDDGSFIEFGQLVIAAQRQRRAIDDLIANTPADGLITGVGSVNSDRFDDEQARCAVLSYDYTVLAGTQGQMNHRKHDRMFELAAEWKLPVVFFTEGGGGRPGDTDSKGVSGLRSTTTFRLFGQLSGLVPLVGINSGRCFAGNAAILGCCDVVIATENSTIGMGGPAMIEGGGLGVFRPEEVGPMDVQVPNGVVDIAVKDEEEAVQVAKQYLSYFQGAVSDWDCADQRLLRHAIPENRLRVYDVRSVIETLADSGSVLELRRHFGLGMVTALARIEGRPIGIIANNPTHLAGAIDAEGADKAARFMQLCEAFDIPILSLCDTPGIMVGPEAEKTALVRHANRLFVVGSNLTVPFLTIVLRKSYGLGAMGMAGGTFKAPFFTVSWPTGEFGGMGLEGQVKLGYRKELAAIADPRERQQRYDEMVAKAYEDGKALNFATYFEIDDVIDPLDTRHWISRALRSVPRPPRREGKKLPWVDTW